MPIRFDFPLHVLVASIAADRIDIAKLRHGDTPVVLVFSNKEDAEAFRDRADTPLEVLTVTDAPTATHFIFLTMRSGFPIDFRVVVDAVSQDDAEYVQLLPEDILVACFTRPRSRGPQ